MEQKPTDELDALLMNTSPDRIADYLKTNRAYLADEKRAFYYYFTDVVKEKGIMLKDVYSFAGVSESYGSQIVAMEKHTKDRDLIIRLCLAGHFSWTEMNRALKLYGFSELYSKEPRDAVIIVALNNRIFDPYRIDEVLEAQDLKKITPDN